MGQPVFIILKRREEMDNKSTWQFGTREVVYGAIGAALYGVFSWATNIFPLPAAGNVTFRPAVAVLIFFAVAYGPWVGLLAGFIGNMLGDALSGWGFYWNWSLGNGLMGMIPGLVMASINDFRARPEILKAIGWGILGIIVGMLFASLTEMFVGGIDLNTAIVGYFAPAVIGNLVVTIILLPILMIAFAAVAARRGR
jgi:energy-coupling factor transport system substrate-specific component